MLNERNNEECKSTAKATNLQEMFNKDIKIQYILLTRKRIPEEKKNKKKLTIGFMSEISVEY